MATKQKQVQREEQDGALVPDLVGLWFHSRDDQGEIQWQGHIIGRPEPGLYLVQLFEWLMGSPSVVRLVRADAMTGWQFYRTGEAMREWHDEHANP